MYIYINKLPMILGSSWTLFPRQRAASGMDGVPAIIEDMKKAHDDPMEEHWEQP